VKNQQAKRYNKKYDSSSTKFTCFRCGKHGHIKVEFPNLLNKEKGQEKRSSKVGKSKSAYIAWEDNDISSSNSSKEEEEAYMCLMTGQQSEVSSVSSNISMNSENYSTLLQAFKETHEEANGLILSNNQMKGLNNWLEDRVKSLAEELLTVKSNVDH